MGSANVIVGGSCHYLVVTPRCFNLKSSLGLGMSNTIERYTIERYTHLYHWIMCFSIVWLESFKKSEGNHHQVDKVAYHLEDFMNFYTNFRRSFFGNQAFHPHNQVSSN